MFDGFVLTLCVIQGVGTSSGMPHAPAIADRQTGSCLALFQMNLIIILGD